jgi:hypothetical protein
MLNVRVEWDRDYTCDIEGPIEIVVQVPARSNVKFLGESVERFDCDGDGRPESSLATETRIEESDSRGRRVHVGSLVEAPGLDFRTRLLLYKDMELAKVCGGSSNEQVMCRGPKY